jgi:hypothetical protein
MTNEVTSPFPVFYDRTGQPLDAGYIYIGTAGINPEVSPITVYWDTSLTTSAAQPIRTLNGYASRDGSPGMLIVNATSYSIVVRDKNGTLVFSELNATNLVIGTGWTTALASPLTDVIREKLTAARNYYVRTDGSNSNTGLANTAVGAFLTIQRAIDVISDTIDLNGFNVTINVANGTYAGAAVSDPWVGSGTVTLVGNVATPSSCIISSTSGPCISLIYHATLTVRGFRVQTSGSGTHGLQCYVGSALDFDTMDFGACVGMHIECGQGSYVAANAAYTISGGGTGHFHCGSFGMITSGTFTVTITGTPAFSSYFAGAAQGNIIVTGWTFTGAATGVRYLSHRGGVISAAAVSPAFPGDVEGRVATGGVYRASVVNPFAIAPDTGVNDSVVLYSRNSNTGVYTPRIDVRNDTTSSSYFFFTGDDSYSSGQTHLGSTTEVLPTTGTQDGLTVKSASAIASSFYVFSASATGAAVGYMKRRTTDGDILVFSKNNVVVGSISVTGAGTAYNVVSDTRLKEKTGRLSNVGSTIDAIEINRFRWNHTEEEQHGVGVMAQDLVRIVPEAVTRGDDNATRRPGDDGWEQWGVDYSKLMPYVIVELQELRRRLAALDGR